LDLNSIIANGNCIVASRIWIGNLTSQPTPAVQLCLSLREKSPWYQRSASTCLCSHPCTEGRRAATAEPESSAGVKPMTGHFAFYQQNWQLNSDNEVFVASQNTRNKAYQPVLRSQAGSAAITKKISTCHQYQRINMDSHNDR